jgi:hypothetical protein
VDSGKGVEYARAQVQEILARIARMQKPRRS